MTTFGELATRIGTSLSVVRLAPQVKAYYLEELRQAEYLLDEQLDPIGQLAFGYQAVAESQTRIPFSLVNWEDVPVDLPDLGRITDWHTNYVSSETYREWLPLRYGLPPGWSEREPASLTPTHIELLSEIIDGERQTTIRLWPTIGIRVAIRCQYRIPQTAAKNATSAQLEDYVPRLDPDLILAEALVRVFSRYDEQQVPEARRNAGMLLKIARGKTHGQAVLHAHDNHIPYSYLPAFLRIPSG